MTQPMNPEKLAELAERGRFWRFVDAVERFLGSRLLLICAYAIVSSKFIEAAGFQFDEWFLCLIIFINLSTKLEDIHTASRMKVGG